MTVAKKAAVKKAPAKRTAPKAPQDRKPKAAPAADVPDTVKAYEPGDAIGPVQVPLSLNEEHTGQHKTLHLIAPGKDQMAWAEAAFYRINLAMRAANEGEEFGQSERGRIYSEIRRLASVFLSDWETDWAEDALAGGHVQMVDVWSAMSDAFTEVGGIPLNPDGAGPDADIVIGG